MKKLKILLFVFALGLTSCGVKPGSVDAPPGHEEETYPKTYPDIATDPAPGKDAPF